MVRRVGIVLAATTALLAGLVTAPVALAGTCPGPCLALTVSNDLNAPPQASTVDYIPGWAVLHGTRSWFFSMEAASALTATNASISVHTGYPKSNFPGVTSFPVSRSTTALNPGQTLSLGLNSTIGETFSAGFSSSRVMSPGVIPAAGGHQTVQVAFKRTTAVDCAAGVASCGFNGNLVTGLAGASVQTVTAPSNLNQSEIFSSNVTGPGADWTVNNPILGKLYVVTVTIKLPARAHSYQYKPWLAIDLSGAGPHGCQVDPCTALATTQVTLADPSLDGATPGAGRITFSAKQFFEWDEGGPPRNVQVRFSGLIH